MGYLTPTEYKAQGIEIRELGCSVCENAIHWKFNGVEKTGCKFGLKFPKCREKGKFKLKG